MRPPDRLVYSAFLGRTVLAPVASWGYRRHGRTGATPRPAYAAMRKLYGCATTAPFERLVKRAAAEGAAVDVDPAGGLAADEVEETVAALAADGYAVLRTRLDAASCDDLEAVARAATCDLVGATGPVQRARFHEATPLAVRYDVAEADILESRAAQRMVADPSLLAIAQRHLGAAPVQDLVAMWWSAAVGDARSSAAAQQFHFDLDRLRFVKVFVYLTDVDADTGPHVYVRGSHRAKPASLRRDGRHADAAVAAAFPHEERTIVGPRGTVFLADTSGLHKGLGLRHHHRLVFQTEYATSLFGGPYTRPVLRSPGPELVLAANRYPSVFRRFRLGDAGPASGATAGRGARWR